MSRFSLIILGSLLLIALRAAAQDVPETYLTDGLRNNLVLQQQHIGLEQSLRALKEARSLFQPTSWLEGQYTLARGGRAISIPVGDLLNPVYQTLNELTGTQKFPQIDNVSEQFLPNNFYDLRVRTTMPLINPDLKYNRSIKEQQVQLARNEVDIYRRELVKEIKTAYYRYLQARQAVDIYIDALQVVQQSLRVNQSLVRNGKGLPAYIARSESEVQQVESQLLQARNSQQNAQAYFNFLINRPLTDTIQAFVPSTTAPLDFPAALHPGVARREELNSLKVAAGINAMVHKMNRSYRTPRLNGFVDLASQGFRFEFSNRSVFYLAGLQVQVPLYTGKRNLLKIEQTALEGKAIQLRQQHTEQQLELSVMVSRNDAVAAYNAYLAVRKQRDAAQQYFRLVDKGYKEGTNSFIEFLDARHSLTNAQLQVNISHYEVLVALAGYERQTASYTFK